MKRIGLLMLAAACCLSACKKQLTRVDAKSIIMEKVKYPKPVTTTVRTIRGEYADTPTYGGMVSAPHQGHINANPLERRAIASGLLAVRALGQHSVFAWCGPKPCPVTFYMTESYFTPAGEALKTGPSQAAGDGEGRVATFWEVKECEEDFAEVTGIALEDKTAEVEYTTRFVRPTGFANSEQCIAGKLAQHKVRFKLFDDGWRLSDEAGVSGRGQ